MANVKGVKGDNSVLVNRIRISTTLPHELNDRLKELQDKGLVKSYLIERAITEYLQNHHQIEIKN